MVEHIIYSVIFESALSYSTVRMAKVYSKKIAFIFRFIQLSIIGYIIG